MKTSLIIKRSLIGLAFFFSTSALMAQKISPKKILGKWFTGEGVVQVIWINDRFVGYPVENGVRNSDVKILNLTYDEGCWEGWLYSVDQDQYFRVECEIEYSKVLQLNVYARFTNEELAWNRIQS